MVTEAVVREALAGASTTPFWLDRVDRPRARTSVVTDIDCDLLVVGGGFCGLWTALRAKDRHPHRDVVVVEAEQVGWAASGRNGGFAEASLTHGAANGRDRWPDEYDTLARLGEENLAGLVSDIRRHGIDCDLEQTRQLTVATDSWQVDELRDARDEGDFLDAGQVRALVDSPTYLAGLLDRDGCVMVDPAKLAWGLARAAESAGVRIFEHSRVRGIDRFGDGMAAELGDDVVRARHVALATNAFPSLLRRARPYVVPVYDYVLVTEPLGAEQRRSIGWSDRYGLADAGNQFHYYRLTADDRILFGGYDAVYHFNKAIRPDLDQRDRTFEKLARHLYDTFPQIAGTGFSHKWGGAIDLCSRFCAFYGQAYDGLVTYATGFTGLGVGATRFAADVMLDLLDGAETERTRLDLVRSKPLPFPPEPFAYGAIQLTRASIAHADAHQGKRNLWLRALDKVGLGFDS